jgi:hypothetical protein
MTTGVKNDDRRVLTPIWDFRQETGVFYGLGNASIGMNYSKSWNGADYSPSPPTSIFQRYFDRIPFDGNPALPDRPKSSYLERWEARRQPRRATVADHQYAMSLSMYSNCLFSYVQRDLSYPGDTWTSLRGFRELYGDGYVVDTASRWTANDTIALQGKLREKIAGSDFNMGIFLGEGREALQLISNTAIRFRKALTALRRGDIRSVATVLGIQSPRSGRILKDSTSSLSQAWLELQYGWLPLLKDTRSAAEALAHQLNVPMQQVYRVRSKKPLIASHNDNILRGKDYFFDGNTKGQLIARVIEVDVPALYGLLDPASVAWELTPWSFVADWFIPIGSYLAARGLNSSLTGTFVTTVTTREFFGCNMLGFSNPKFGITFPPQYRVLKVSVDRQVSTSLFTPRPNFKPLSSVSSWQHCANAVALLTSRFGSK